MKPKTGSRKKIQTRTKQGTFGPKLTRKQKAFADALIADKKKSATVAVLETYNTTDKPTAGVIAHENLKNPNIQLYLNEHIDKAKTKIVELIDSNREEIALKSAQDVLDRSLGKAKQQIETTNKTVKISLDLTGQ